jgi:Methyltransferase domain
MIPKALKKIIPSSFKTRLNAIRIYILTRFVDWRIELIARLAAPLKKQDDFGRYLFGRLEAKGLHVLPVHYYSPIPDTRELRNGDQGWRQEVDLSDIQFNIEEQRRLGEAFKVYQDEISSLPDHDELCRRGYGLGYGPIEAMLLHSFIRHVRPKRIVEVGSGVSTVYEAGAISLNDKGDGGGCSLICIEPYPRPLLRSIPEVTEVIPKKVQEVPLDVFRMLDAGDILFIDSSHIVKVGSDTNYLYTQVLPALAQGVLVHIHDIYFPYLTQPDVWLFDRLMFWQETVLLKALLSGNRHFEIVYCSSYLHHKEPDTLRKTFPVYDPSLHYPQSIWLRKVKG